MMEQLNTGKTLNNDSKTIKRKTNTDKIVRGILFSLTLFCSLIVVFITIFIVIKGVAPFLKTYEIDGESVKVDLGQFLFGDTYFKSPASYGIGFVLINTIYVTFLALLIAVPISVLTALFIVRVAPKPFGSALNSVIELLASIPSVIFGMFGAGVITNIVKNISSTFNFQSSGGLSTLASVIVLALMIIPTITMISVTAISSVKQDQVLGSLALGASRTETNYKVVLTGAKNGIISGVILGTGRALGEATAVSMVCGNAYSGPTFNLFEKTRTLTSSMLQNIHETSGLDYDIRFSIGLILIIIIIFTNILLNIVKNRIGKKHGK